MFYTAVHIARTEKARNVRHTKRPSPNQPLINKAFRKNYYYYSVSESSLQRAGTFWNEDYILGIHYLPFLFWYCLEIPVNNTTLLCQL